MELAVSWFVPSGYGFAIATTACYKKKCKCPRVDCNRLYSCAIIFSRHDCIDTGHFKLTKMARQHALLAHCLYCLYNAP